MTGLSLLPANATAQERAVEAAIGGLEALPIPTRAVWSAADCPAELLPWLAWGVSVDIWNSNWTEGQKREAVAEAIAEQRRKGTPVSLRAVIDRFDPMIAVVEWFEDRDVMEPHTFRLELPLAADSGVVLDEALVLALLRDIAAVKPLRAHMQAVIRLKAEVAAFIVGSVRLAGFARLDREIDLSVPLEPAWANYLQTEDGEPVRAPDGEFLETA